MSIIFPKRKILMFTGLLTLILVLVFAANTALAEEPIAGGMGAGLGAFFSVISHTAYWIAAGVIGLSLTTGVLQWLIIHQTELVNFNNPFITNGLSMTQGLADMLLILAFVVASFGIIFKYREFEAKKTVVTLVLVAIATHFGKLIVEMMVDIGNVAINTIVGSGNTLLWDATSLLLKETVNTLGSSIVYVIAPAAIAFSIPWVNILTLGATLYGITSAAAVLYGVDNVLVNAAGGVTLYVAINYLLKWIFQIFACYMLIGVYITYIILFVSRIFMMQILAVISPLAIMANALPQTKRFYTQWWQSLVKWTFVGVWTLFFLMLGLGSAGFIVPNNISVTDAGSGDNILKLIALSRYMLYYLFLIVYLALVKDMAQKDSGMGTLFKSAMIGAGGAVFANAIKPATNSAHSHLAQMALDKKAEIGDSKPSFLDNLALHGSGFMANLTDEKQLSNVHSMFSGDSAKAQTAAQSMAKTFDLGKLKSFSDTSSLIDSKISEVGKDFTVEKIIAMNGKANVQQAIWAMKNAKAEDMPKLMESLGADGGKYLNYAIKEGKLTPNTIQTIARSTNALESSSELKKYLIDQDSNKSILKQAMKFSGLDPNAEITDPAVKEEIDNMRARAQNLKSSTTNREVFKKLSDNVFDSDDNLKAMLLTAPESLFGFANSTNSLAETKLRAAAKTNFAELAKANPELIRAIGRTSFKYQDVIPDDIKARAEAQAAAQAPDMVNRRSVEDFIRDETERMAGTTTTNNQTTGTAGGTTGPTSRQTTLGGFKKYGE